jgi:hypothetical protein
MYKTCEPCFPTRTTRANVKIAFHPQITMHVVYKTFKPHLPPQIYEILRRLWLE